VVDTTAVEATTTPTGSTLGATPSTTRRTTARTGGGGSTTAPPAPGSVRAPVGAGSYRYATTGTFTVGLSTTALPGVTTLSVDAPSGGRQRTVRDVRDGSGNGTITETTLEYRPDGLYLVEVVLRSSFAGVSDMRRISGGQPLLFLPTTAVPGTKVSLQASVIDSGGQVPGEASMSLEVLGGETVTLGDGERADTRPVRLIVTLPPDDVTGRQDITLWLAHGSGLALKERSVTDGSGAGGLVQVRTDYAATLESR